LILGLALISNKNPDFQMASKKYASFLGLRKPSLELLVKPPETGFFRGYFPVCAITGFRRERKAAAERSGGVRCAGWPIA
jgi:hypothetical protein